MVGKWSGNGRDIIGNGKMVGKSGNARKMVCGTRYQVPGTRYLAPGTWYCPGTRYLVPGAWYLVPGTRYVVPGTTHSARTGLPPRRDACGRRHAYRVAHRLVLIGWPPPPTFSPSACYLAELPRSAASQIDPGAEPARVLIGYVRILLIRGITGSSIRRGPSRRRLR